MFSHSKRPLKDIDLALKPVCLSSAGERALGDQYKVKGGKKMISERTLRKWRRDALEFKENTADIIEARPILEVCDRVLKLTQELLDQHLLRRKK